MRNITATLLGALCLATTLWASGSHSTASKEEEKEASYTKMAPAFALPSHDGKTIKLNDFRGKTVVLEWINYDCPFVKKFYDAGKMQEFQKKAMADGVVWLCINSSAKGKQGNFSSEEITKRLTNYGSTPTAYLLDTDGSVGKAYDAKTTPHMYVIDKEGRLVYQGAIDSIRSTDASDIDKATNYVMAALDNLKAGKDVAEAKTRAYGCGVKY